MGPAGGHFTRSLRTSTLREYSRSEVLLRTILLEIAAVHGLVPYNIA